MSEDVWDAGGLIITTYAGPVRADGGNRRRVQITVWDTRGLTRTYTTLSMSQWAELRRAAAALGPDCKPGGADIAARRHALVARVGNLWRGDWTGHSFDGRDGQRWLDAAMGGNADDLDQLDAELTGYEQDR